MIFFSLVDGYLRNFQMIKLYNSVDNPNMTAIVIKDASIIIGLVLIIYLLLQQVNQSSNCEFEFKFYNKILFVVMLIDVIIAISYVFRHIINNSIQELDKQLK